MNTKNEKTTDNMNRTFKKRTTRNNSKYKKTNIKKHETKKDIRPRHPDVISGTITLRGPIVNIYII